MSNGWRKGFVLALVLGGSMSYGMLVTEAAEAAKVPLAFDLEGLVITANRVATRKVDTPANINVISAEKLESRNYQNVGEALKDVPGVNVLDTGYGTNEKTIILNGDERVLVLVDGKRVNIDMGSTGSGRSGYDVNQLPPMAIIERIEVLKGAGGSLYGSDAVGGVVNIITKKIDHNFGKASVSMGSSGSRDYNIMYGGKNKKTTFMVAASRYKQDYYKYKNAKTGETERWPGNSDFLQDKLSLKLGQEIGKRSNLTLNYDYSKYDGTSPYDATSPFPSQSNKSTNNLALKYDWVLKEKDAGYIQVFQQKLDYFNAGNMKETNYGFEGLQELTTSKNNKVVFGASYRNAKADNEFYYTEEKSINNAALFVSDLWKFAPTWQLNTGLRYDRHSTAGNKATMSMAVNKKFNENSNAFVSWGQVFKAPNIDDLYYYADYGAWGKYLGNPDLKPETGDTWTIGYNTKIGKKTEVGISYFQSSLKDAIDWWWNPADYNTYAININKQKKKGMELSISHALNDNVDLEASYTYLSVENNTQYTDGYEKDHNVVPNVYRFGVRYHNALWNADWFLRAGSGASAASYVDSSYLTMDLNVSYKLRKDWKIFAKGYNLTNAAYAEQGGVSGGMYRHPAQSRRFLVGMEYTF